MTHATNPTLIERTALCSVQRTGSAPFGRRVMGVLKLTLFGWAF